MSAFTELQEERVKVLIRSPLREARRDFDRAAGETLAKAKWRNPPDYMRMLTDTIEANINILRSYERSACYTDITDDTILQLYEIAIDEIIDAAFKRLDITGDHKKALRNLACAYLVRDVYSEYLTGLVFTGFGENETFPSIIAYEMDGIIAEKLKRKETVRENTGRTSIEAEIIPFAQRERVDCFLYGVDPEKAK